MEGLLSTEPTPSSLSCTIEAISIYFVQKNMILYLLTSYFSSVKAASHYHHSPGLDHPHTSRLTFTHSTEQMHYKVVPLSLSHFCCYSLRSTLSCQPGLQRTTGVHCTDLHCTVPAQLTVEGPVLYRVHCDLHPVTPLTSVITAACRRQPEQNWNYGGWRQFSRN